MLNTGLLYVGKRPIFLYHEPFRGAGAGLGGAASLLLSSCVSILMSSNSYWPGDGA